MDFGYDDWQEDLISPLADDCDDDRDYDDDDENFIC